jgi:hypothetical protein
MWSFGPPRRNLGTAAAPFQGCGGGRRGRRCHHDQDRRRQGGAAALVGGMKRNLHHHQLLCRGKEMGFIWHAGGSQNRFG